MNQFSAGSHAPFFLTIRSTYIFWSYHRPSISDFFPPCLYLLYSPLYPPPLAHGFPSHLRRDSKISVIMNCIQKNTIITHQAYNPVNTRIFLHFLYLKRKKLVYYLHDKGLHSCFCVAAKSKIIDPSSLDMLSAAIAN